MFPSSSYSIRWQFCPENSTTMMEAEWWFAHAIIPLHSLAVVP